MNDNIDYSVKFFFCVFFREILLIFYYYYVGEVYLYLHF